MGNVEKRHVDPTIALLIDQFVHNDRVGARAVADRRVAGSTPLSFIEDVAVPALEEVGRRWESGEMALAQVYLAGRVCESVVDEILTDAGAQRRSQPRIAIAAISDQHTLGKRVVSIVVRAAGYDLADYGAGIEPEPLARKAASDSIDLLLLSALMLSSAAKVDRVKRQLAKLKATTRLIVGGAPFRLDPSLWQRVGADACGATASDAVRLIAGLGGSR